MQTPPRPSSPVFEAASAAVDAYTALSPITATWLGVSRDVDDWDDLSPEGDAAQLDFWRTLQAETRALAPQGDDDALAVAVMLDTAETEIARLLRPDALHDINCISSKFQAFTRVFEHMPAETPAHGEVIRRRLEALPQAITGFQARLAQSRDEGRISARRQLLAALAQGRLAAGPRAELVHITSRWPGPAMDRALAGAQGALGGLCDWIEAELLPVAPEEDAVGAERYAAAAREHLGMALDPVETYAWGWSEIHRIDAEIAVVLRELHLGHDLTEAMETLRADPQHIAPDAETFLDLMRQRQQRALEALDGVCFDVPPPARELRVRLAPEGGPIGAYYSGPPEDFSRPGTVWYSLERRENIPYFVEISTAHHEGFPGHHLHVSTMRWKAERLSRFQRLLAQSPGHLEGWALYAERLMRELGFLEHPAYVLGMLTCELVRAWRVVVDIGCHLKLRVPEHAGWRPGEVWSYALAVEALQRRAMLGPGAAASNATRYLGWPGQAITYKLGERVVLELREQQKKLHGEHFDMKRFHASLVDVGSLGLSRLRAVVGTA